MAKLLSKNRIIRLCIYGLAGCCLLFLLLVAVIHFYIFPRLNAYKPEVESFLSQQTGVTVHIEHMEGSWAHGRPRIRFRNATAIRSENNRKEVLASIHSIDAILGWSSLWKGNPQFYALTINSPRFHIERTAEGTIQFAERVLIGGDASNPDHAPILQWISEQGRMQIESGELHWHDHLRNAPIFEIRDIQLNFDKQSSNYHLQLGATPPQSIADPFILEVNSNLSGGSAEDLENWHGTIRLQLENMHAKTWMPWVDVPDDLLEMYGALALDLQFAHGSWESVKMHIAAEQVGFRLGPDLDRIVLPFVDADVTVKPYEEGVAVETKNMVVVTREKKRIAPQHFAFRWSPGNETLPARGDFAFNKIELNALNEFVRKIPLPSEWRKQLLEANPGGTIKNIKIAWEQENEDFKIFDASLAFENLVLQAGVVELGEQFVIRPGVKNLTGQLHMNLNQVQVQLDSEDTTLTYPTLLEHPEVHFEKLKAELIWNLKHEQQLIVHQLQLQNSDVKLQIEGYMQSSAATGKRDIHLVGHADYIRLSAIHQYLPQSINKDAREWLRRSLVEGYSNDTNFLLSGPLDTFPYPDPNSAGIFKIDAKLLNAIVDYTPEDAKYPWPKIGFDEGSFAIDKAKISVITEYAHLDVKQKKSVPVNEVRVTIPDMTGQTQQQVLFEGTIAGEAQNIIAQLKTTPLHDIGSGLLNTLIVSKNVQVPLTIHIPLHSAQEVAVKGSIYFNDNLVQLAPELPSFHSLKGRVEFNQHAWTIPFVSGSTLSGPIVIRGSALQDSTNVMTILGSAQGSALEQLVRMPDKSLEGTLRYQGRLVVDRSPSIDLTLETDLNGVQSNVPSPFYKEAHTLWPSQFHIQIQDNSARLSWAVANAFDMTIERTFDSNRQPAHWSSASILIGSVPLSALKPNVFYANINVPYVDSDAWLDYIHRWPKDENTLGGSEQVVREDVGSASAFLCSVPTNIQLRVHQVQAIQPLTNFSSKIQCGGKPDRRQAQFIVDSDEIAGGGVWKSVNGVPMGLLQAHFDKVLLRDMMVQPDEKVPTASVSKKGSASLVPSDLPNMQVTVDRFSIDDALYGRVHLDGLLEGNAWLIRKLQYSSAGGILLAQGRWEPAVSKGTNANSYTTNLTLDVALHNAGNWLHSLGLETPIMAGRGSLTGNVRWNGAPYIIDWRSLDGDLALNLHEGEIHPTKVSVLPWLNLVSIRTLPRRLQGDFSDLHYNQFVFNTIDGAAHIHQGVLDIQKLHIQGVGADANINGLVDIPKQSQSLVIAVKPKIDFGLLSLLYAATANTPVGLTSLFAQLLFAEPISQGLSFRLAVDGTWDKPAVQSVD